jgi:hypothetical protein
MTVHKVSDKVLELLKDSEKDYASLLDKSKFGSLSYNAISSAILKKYIKFILYLEKFDNSITPQNNLLILFYNHFITDIVNHYFTEYEKQLGLIDKRSGKGVKIHSRSNIFQKNIFRSATNRLFLYLEALKNSDKTLLPFAGHHDFHFGELIRRSYNNNIKYFELKTSNNIYIPNLKNQIQVCKQLIFEIHCDFSLIYNFNFNKTCMYDFNRIFSLGYKFIDSEIVKVDQQNIKFLLTGTFVNHSLSQKIMHYQSTGIKHIFLCHGGGHIINNEPVIGFTVEGALPDIKFTYGNLNKIKKEYNPFNTNIWNNKIKLHSRQDSRIDSKNYQLNIEPIKNLKGKKLVYFPNHFQSKRYGPHMSTHPMIYLSFQIKMVKWFKKNGAEVIIKPHPKRPSTDYDVIGNEEIQTLNDDLIKDCDGFIIDFPTTSLQILSCSNKPIIYFDLQIRRLFEGAKDAIYDRCHYSIINLNDPAEGLDMLELDLHNFKSNKFTDTVNLSKSKRSEFDEINYSLNLYNN